MRNKSKVLQIGRYKIIEELGRGGMGIVYKAYDPVIERTVALKMINFRDFASSSEIDELKTRFKQEVKAVGKLSHPNIVTVHDVTEKEGIFCIVMEYVEGESVDKLLAKKRVISVEDSVRIITKICDALGYAHRQGIVHRDVKPANIIITKDGVPKLMDFGIAKLADSTVTKTGSALGTPSYTAPEMIKSQKTDSRADIFSLGCVFYEMVTGERAFPGENITPIMYKILEEEPTPPVDLNKRLPSVVNTIIFKSLAKDLAERYQSVDEFAQDLATLITHPEAIPVIKRKKRVRLARLILPLGISVISALIIIFLILFMPQLFRKEVSKVEWAENILYAKAKNGKEVWRKVFDAEIKTAVVSDINNDGRNEVAVGTTSRKSNKGSWGEINGMIYLLDAKGREIWCVNAGVQNAYRDFDDKYTVSAIQIEDLDNDNYNDIISISNRTPWFPIRLLIQYGTKDLKIKKTLEYWHPGSVRIEHVEDINNDGSKDLICTGVNNDMGSRGAIFAIGTGLHSSISFAQAPPWKGNIGYYSGMELWYIVLGGRDNISSVTKFKNNILQITTARSPIFLDYNGNLLETPQPLPLEKSKSRILVRKDIFENWRIAIEFSKNKNFEFAINKLKKAINLKSDNFYLSSVLHMELGNIYYEVGQYDNAINEYKKSLEIDPRCYYVYLSLGITYWLKTRYKDAIELYIKGVALFSDLWEGNWMYRYLIESYMLDGDINKISELCERAKNPPFNGWVSFSKVGDAYVWMGKFREAMETYKDVLSIDTLNSYNFVFTGLAKTYAYTDTNLDEAERMITEAIKEDPVSDSSLAGVLGWIYFKQAKVGKKTYDIALNEVNKAIAYYSNENHPIQIYRPTLAELYFFLANICELMGKLEDAKKHYQTCLKLNRGNTYIKRVTETKLKEVIPQNKFN